MKHFWLIVALLAPCSGRCYAHPETGGPEHPTEFPALARTLQDADGRPAARVRVGLTVEAGVFYFREPGRLRAYSHRYRYAVRNLDLRGDDESIVTRFSPAVCLPPPIAAPPVLVGGGGDPSTWLVRPPEADAAAFVHWEAADPDRDGIPSESEWSFVLYTNAEPVLGFVGMAGQTTPAEDGVAQWIGADFLYWVPGCQSETRAGVAELDWEKSVDASVSAAGRMLTYTLRATNVGSGAATGVVIVDPILDGLSYQAGTTWLNGTLMPDPGPGRCALDEGLVVPAIPPGGAAEVRFQVRVKPGQPGGGTIENTASLSTEEIAGLPSRPTMTTLLPPDTTPPRITIASPSAGTHRKPESAAPAVMTLRFSAADTDPGIDTATLHATLDETPVQSGQVVDLLTLRPGPHALRIRASDWAGNAADVTVSFTVEATFTSAMYEIARMEQMGWIRMWRTTALLNQLLETARTRVAAGDRPGARASLQAFIASVTDPRRRLSPQPLLTAEAAAHLEATAKYLLGQLQ